MVTVGFSVVGAIVGDVGLVVGPGVGAGVVIVGPGVGGCVFVEVVDVVGAGDGSLT